MTRRPRNRYVFEKCSLLFPLKLTLLFMRRLCLKLPFSVNLCWFWDKARSARWSERAVNIMSLTLAFTNPQFGQFLGLLFLPAPDAYSDVIVELARRWQVVVIWHVRSSRCCQRRERAKGVSSVTRTHARTHAFILGGLVVFNCHKLSYQCGGEWRLEKYFEVHFRVRLL